MPDHTPLVIHKHETPLGPMVLVADASAIRLADFHDRRHIDIALGRLATQLGPIEQKNSPMIDRARSQLDDYFAGTRRAFDLPLAPAGSAFQSRVWLALQAIPYAATIHYGQLAQRVGDVKAVRAVAGANGQNFISVIIPCHRVIGADGTLTGYGGGLARKAWLIEHEARVAGIDAHAPSLFAQSIS